jgi:glycosyltransferase involved in cell wall biosynthesis
MEQLPLISCIMLTYSPKRIEYIKESIQCFKNQTYPNKELVIVNNGNPNHFHAVNALIEGMENVKHFQAPMSIVGEYRNAGLAHSAGEFVATWDDDDLRADNYLEYEYSIIANHNVDAVMLMDFKEMKMEKGCVAVENGRITMGLDGTILFKNPKGTIVYSPMSRGEDTDFVRKLSEAGYKIMVLKNDPAMYTYRFHGSNITVSGGQ